MKVIIVLLLFLALPASGEKTENKVSLSVDDVPVIQVLQALAESEKYNLVVAPGVQGSVTLRLDGVSWTQALHAVVEIAGLYMTRDGRILRIYPGSWPAERATRREALKRPAPLISAMLPLRHADAAEVVASITSGLKLLSPAGSVVADKRLNSLLVHDTKSVVEQLARVVTEMDVPLGQVELAAHIVTINQQTLRELGVKWGNGTQNNGKKMLFSTEAAVPGATSRLGFSIGRVGGSMLEFELSALEKRNQLEIIASPRLLASHQQPASIKQGSEIPYHVSSGDSGATSVEFKEAVLGMEVTPVIQQGGRIRLKLRISQNMPGQVLQQESGEALAIDKQEIETQVEVKNGETIALGGIFQQTRKNDRNRVPVLGAIPLLGGLFRHQGKDNERRELVVFITPRLVAIK